MSRKTMPKTVLLALALALCLLPAWAAAQNNSGGFVGQTAGHGFQGPGPRIVTVQDVQTMPDDSKVALRGNIIQHLGGEDYAFQDATGTINVEIDDKRWRGQSITPQDTVEITGKVDRDWGGVEIEVKSVNKVQ